jgi:hypothetical protein
LVFQTPKAVHYHGNFGHILMAKIPKVSRLSPHPHALAPLQMRKYMSAEDDSGAMGEARETLALPIPALRRHNSLKTARTSSFFLEVCVYTTTMAWNGEQIEIQLGCFCTSLDAFCGQFVLFEGNRETKLEFIWLPWLGVLWAAALLEVAMCLVIGATRFGLAVMLNFPSQVALWTFQALKYSFECRPGRFCRKLGEE